ncbi:hypothetical protein [Hymenobacter latericus]|uniref:hypothetical protein n=1 Tax=Hymenobacter sp. YIM 151858-1 TaxID=2987688 RepID=UPI0022270393|nr:hypothetical protein [Hymenobacter sp. YIM 151858-1]UYZ60973.1 hypothetical protein OIS50_09245 [Hymenobacter sp. YIM 151858-1]
MKNQLYLICTAFVCAATLVSGCTKTSDQVSPKSSVALPTEQNSVPGYGSTVGFGCWQPGFVLGLPCNVYMTIVSEALIPGQSGGIVARWTGKAACPPAEKLSYKTNYTTETGIYYEYQSVTETNGDVKMVTFYLPAKQ